MSRRHIYSNLDVWLTEVLVLSGATGIHANLKESVPRQRKHDRRKVSLANLILPVWRRHRLSLDLHTVFRKEKLGTLKVLLSIETTSILVI